MEEWRKIFGFPYEVSNFGRVRHTNGRFKNPRSCNGYNYVWLYRGKKFPPRVVKIAALVAETFLGPRPQGQEVDHINRNSKDDCLTNLRYLTPKENKYNTSHFLNATNVYRVQSTPRLHASYRVRLFRDGRNLPFGSYHTYEYAKWVADFVKRHERVFVL